MTDSACARTSSTLPEAPLRAVENHHIMLEAVGRMKASACDNVGGQASDYWAEELEGFDYMAEASPRILAKLRQHTYHLTGLRVYDYRSSQDRNARLVGQKLADLRRLDERGLLVPESPELGGFGHRIDDRLYNVDTLKFYECLIAMDAQGVLGPFVEQGSPRRLVVEIGGGWGGLAYQFKTLFPNVTYVIVDFPEVFLFSAVYLMTMFPGCSVCAMASEQDASGLADAWRQYDFVFMPASLFDRTWTTPADLAINTVSFQEMTTAQVDAYARRLAESGCRTIYSLNRDRSPHNAEMTAVSEILGEHFDVTEADVLDVPYNVLEAPQPPASKWRIGRRAKAGPSVFDYRHLVGRQRG